MGSFEKDYFIKSSISNYSDYRQKKYVNLADDIIKTLQLKHGNRIIDYGCAVGQLIVELKKRGITCYGTDISDWAINFGRNIYGLENELFNYFKPLLNIQADYVLMLDVLEHCDTKELYDILEKIKENKKLKGILVRIPVCKNEGEDFFLEISRKDKTHIQKHCKLWWKKLFKTFNLCIKKSITEKTIYDSEGVLVWLLEKEKRWLS